MQRLRCKAAGLLLAGSLLFIPIPAGALCIGDCDDSGSVTVDELITGVNIALGNRSIDVCLVFEANGDGTVTVDELITAVNNALNGCPPTAVSQEIGPTGGSLTSSDGRFTLNIPEGALAETTTITITSADASSLGAAFESFGIVSAYELGPDGLHFAVPATAELLTDQAPVQPDGSLSVRPAFLFTEEDGQPAPLAAASLTADSSTNTVKISGELAHFSRVLEAGVPGSAWSATVLGLPQEAPADGVTLFPILFGADLVQDESLTLSDDVSVILRDFSEKEFRPANGERHFELEKVGATNFFREVPYTCFEAGLGGFDVSMLVMASEGRFEGRDIRPLLASFRFAERVVICRAPGATMTPTPDGPTSTPTPTRTPGDLIAIESFQANPTEGLAPLDVLFQYTLQLSGVTGTPMCRIDFGDGMQQDPVSCLEVGNIVGHIYTQPGQYRARLTVTDGPRSDFWEVIIRATNRPPEILGFFADPARGDPPLTATFKWEIRDPDNEDAERQSLRCVIDVDISDGDDDQDYAIDPCDSLDVQQHTYTDTGEFTARLFVLDDFDARAQASTAVSTVTTFIRRVSVGSNGEQGNGHSQGPVMSADGCIVAFESEADNLVSGDSNGLSDVFVNDCGSGETLRVSVDSGGAQRPFVSRMPGLNGDGSIVAFVSATADFLERVFIHDVITGDTELVTNGEEPPDTHSFHPVVSFGGRYVAFESGARTLDDSQARHDVDIFVYDRDNGSVALISAGTTDDNNTFGSCTLASIGSRPGEIAYQCTAEDLVPDDTNEVSDVFVAGTTRVSISSAGVEGGAASRNASISRDGRFVAFDSLASNLVEDDANETSDVFVHDRDTGMTTRISVSSAGVEGNGPSDSPAISADGRFVTFLSFAGNLVEGDTNGRIDVFVHDRDTQQTTRVSVTSQGQQLNAAKNAPAVGVRTDAGSVARPFVAFQSSGIFVPEDTNGVNDIYVVDVNALRAATGD